MVSCNVFSTVDFNITWHRRGYPDRLRNSKKFTIYNNGSLIIRFVLMVPKSLTLCLLVTSGDSLCKQFGPRSGPTKCRASSGSKLFDVIGIPEIIFQKR